jgi:hypothetical protein
LWIKIYFGFRLPAGRQEIRITLAGGCVFWRISDFKNPPIPFYGIFDAADFLGGHYPIKTKRY